MHDFLQNVQMECRGIPCKSMHPEKRLTSVWTMLTRCDLNSLMQLKISTTPSFSAISSMMSTAMKQPVLPAPALHREKGCQRVTVCHIKHRKMHVFPLEWSFTITHLNESTAAVDLQILIRGNLKPLTPDSVVNHKHPWPVLQVWLPHSAMTHLFHTRQPCFVANLFNSCLLLGHWNIIRYCLCVPCCLFLFAHLWSCVHLDFGRILLCCSTRGLSLIVQKCLTYSAACNLERVSPDSRAVSDRT